MNWWAIIIYLWAGITIAHLYWQIDELDREYKFTTTKPFTWKGYTSMVFMWPICVLVFYWYRAKRLLDW